VLWIGTIPLPPPITPILRTKEHHHHHHRRRRLNHHHYHHNNNNNNHITVMELGHLLTRSGLTYPEVSSKVYHDFFCQLGVVLTKEHMLL